MHNAIQIQLSCPNDNVFPAFFDFCWYKRIRLINAPQACKHFWQFRGSYRFNGDFEDRLRHVFNRPEYMQIFFDAKSCQSCSLGNRSIDPTDQNKVSGWNFLCWNKISVSWLVKYERLSGRDKPGFTDPKIIHNGLHHVLLVFRRVPFTQNLDVHSLS